jgi:hypothetical protein
MKIRASHGFLLHLLSLQCRVSELSLRVYWADDGPVRSVLLNISF